MFDLRYHVASLAAVFLALVVGILVGVGLSGRGFVDDAERKNLTGQISDLRDERDLVRSELEEALRRGDALDDFAETTYPALVRGRLRDAQIAMVFVGSVDQTVARAIADGIRDAGGEITRMRALRVPIDGEAFDDVLRSRPSTRALAGPDRRDDLGRALGRELVTGGPSPLWEQLEGLLVEERAGRSRAAADGVVIARPAPPQQGETQDFLSGLYDGLVRSGAPAVGADPSARVIPAIPAFRRAGLSTVDSVDTATGKLALVLLLAGGAAGSYGVEDDAADGVLPSVPPSPPSGPSG